MDQLDRHPTDSAIATAIVRALPEAGVVIFDRDLRVTFAAGAPLEGVAWRSPVLVGQRLPELVPVFIYDQIVRGCLTALAGERTALDVIGPRTGRRYSLVLEPLGDEDGTTVAGLALLRDPGTSDWPALASDPRFDLVFDSAPNGMALLSTTGRCVRANQALADLLGHTELELLARSFDDVLHPDEAPETRRQTQMLLGGEILEFGGERRLRHADGGIVHVVARVTLARNDDGRPRHLVVQFKDASEKRQMEYRLQELAERDTLTGLPNRPLFERELERQVAAGGAGEKPAALLLLDLDHFKYINDAHGHRIGDELLRRVAGRVRRELPAGTLVARLGGDELAALLVGTAGPEAELVAEGLLTALRAERLSVGSDVLGTTASVGVAELSDDADAEAVLVAADLAMYEAKASGGDRAVLHDPRRRGRERISDDLRWSQRIRATLEDDRLELHAQPIVDATSGVPLKYEMLVRMRTQEGELVLPGDFLPHAERFGLVAEIDRWVIGQVVVLAARHDVTLALNLSGRSVGDPALLAFVEAEIAAAGLDPRRLVFEVTETAAIASMGDAQRLATGLRGLGCGFTLDDFGAGFASFTYVKQLPFDFLKIDGSFVRDLPTSVGDRLVVGALVEVARGLGKQTVAEFVCSPSVLAEAQACGVDLVQGHHIGAPAPLEAWLDRPAVPA